MAQASTDKSIGGLPLNVGLFSGIVISFFTVLGGAAGFQYWVDSRIDSRVDSYANVEIYPRIVELERTIRYIRDDQEHMIKMLEKQKDMSVAQYKKILEMLSRQEQ